MRMRSLARFVLVIGACSGWAGGASAQLKKPTPDDINKDIVGLKAGGNAQTFASKRLGEYESPLPEKQAEVAGLLMKLVKDNKSYNAMRSLSVWATDAELKEIQEYLGSGDLSKAAVFVYSKKKYAPAARPLAGLLESGGGDYKVLVEALIQQAPDSEEHVLPYLASKNKNAVKSAVAVLSRGGTKKSLEPLAKVSAEYEKKDKNLATEAKVAIGKIEEREKGGKDK